MRWLATESTHIPTRLKGARSPVGRRAEFPSRPPLPTLARPQSPTSLSWSPMSHRKWKLRASRAVPSRSPSAVRYGMEKLSGSLPLRHMECTIQSAIHNNSSTWKRGREKRQGVVVQVGLLLSGRLHGGEETSICSEGFAPLVWQTIREMGNLLHPHFLHK